MSLEQIAADIQACTNCSLCQTRTNTVPGEGSNLAKIMFVGEGPGEQEDLQGRPFVGRAGNLLTEALQKAGLDRNEVFISNIVKCRPPGNRNPNVDEMTACHSFLFQQIDLIKPDLIVILGKVAAEFLLQRRVKITKEHGRFDFLPQGTCAMTVLHPAYILRNQNPDVRERFFEAFHIAKFLAYGEG